MICFGACFVILPLPTSLKVGGVFGWAGISISHSSFLPVFLWGWGGGPREMPLLKRGGLFLLW